MTATHSSDARQEAERRYPASNFPGDNIGLRVGFVEGAEWKGAQIADEILPILERLQDYHGDCCTTPLRELYRALSGVESSDEG